MRGNYTRWIMQQPLKRVLERAVEIATAKHKEECELRLARIQNGKEPSHQNGPWPGKKNMGHK